MTARAHLGPEALQIMYYVKQIHKGGLFVARVQSWGPTPRESVLYPNLS